MYVRRSDFYEDEEEEDGEDLGGGSGIQHQHQDDRRVEERTNRDGRWRKGICLKKKEVVQELDTN